jgi:hypothetical protein
MAKGKETAGMDRDGSSRTEGNENPARKIAKKFKRTQGATRQKAWSMGLSLDSR